ncbi:MAG TPA: plastocyanin/azurin family copper-binding protein [Ktedonobacterales bacterium]|nr:plastocyanin/azurin family copper-binding protein [Ktedonobacterales bacterium]
MESNRNPGVIAVSVGVGLAVIFALMAITGALKPETLGLGLAAVSLVVAALIYIFYMRANTVTKTGYAALLMIIATGLIIPFLTFTQPQAQANATSQQYDLTLQRGAALYGQYCSSCHGFQGQGLAGPQLNGNPAIAKLTDQDLTRIISGGIANPNDPSKLLMPAWLNTYGGSLTQDDIGYLVSLIRSTDKAYIAKNHLEDVNGFSYVFASLTNPTQIAQYNAQKAQGNAPQKPAANTFTNLTTQKAVTIDGATDSTNLSGFGWLLKGGAPANITISVGTTVTWMNITPNGIPHNVVSGYGNKSNGLFPTSPLLNSGGAGYSFTFTKAGEYPYYCGVHPSMIGWITVK